MNSKYIDLISKILSLQQWQVENTVRLLEEGATIPFISRYRKEKTGSLNEVQIIAIQEQYKRLQELDKRRETILKTIEEQGKLTNELKEKILKAETISELEDLYLPYRPKKRTRALIAKENGLEPLAKVIFNQNIIDLELEAQKFISDKVRDLESAIQGARDIIAEWISENKNAREAIRRLFAREAIIKSTVIKGKENEAIKYQDYFSFSEPLKSSPSHRILAIFRGEKEGFLKITLEPSEEKALEILEKLFIKADNQSSHQVKLAIKDSYKRLLAPSIETEFRNEAKTRADEEAIKVFAENLRQLLMSPPFGNKRILAIDPGYKTGCKVVILDENGNLLHNETIYPNPPQNEVGKSAKKIDTLISQYKVDAIAIGNGTASRETERFIKSLRFSRDIKVFVVNEAGASVYSTSKVGREEFPDYDVTVRGAVSIGRRLMDPLAELVKIDPKSIGVGQYQHDVDQNRLKEALDNVVISCVNMVGVDVNTASKHLLTYVSGLGPQLAQNIVEYRSKNGPFRSREELKRVPRMGDKAFEQSAGFLRIRDGINPLDNTAVHPESYYIVEKIAKKMGVEIKELIEDKDLRKKICLEDFVDDRVGLPTLNDIMEELEKPGRDPRKEAKILEFAEGIYSIEDIKPGMILPGIVTNITNFGAFVDIGIKQNGLVHISQMTDKFIKSPLEVVKLHQHVKVKVLDVDVQRGRINLTMKGIF